MTFGAAILAGGKSLRMGRDKAGLTFNGTAFLRSIAEELSCFDERLLSVASPRKNSLGLTEVCDKYHDRGPMAGLLACLNACKSDALLFVPCDVPLFTAKLGKYLCSLLSEEYDAVIAVSFDGQEHPLCAVYRKSAAEAFKATLEEGKNSIFCAFDKLRVLKAPISNGGFTDRLLTNINSPEEYARFCGAAITNIFLVGDTGAGKSDVIDVTTELLGKRLGGFITTMMRGSDGSEHLCMFGPSESPADISAHVVASPADNPSDISGRFNALGCAYLENSTQSELIIMDELGSLEKNAADFLRAVQKALDSPVPVLGALHEGIISGWLLDLAQRSDVRIITVTDENRDTLPIVLTNIINSIRPPKTLAEIAKERAQRQAV